MAGNVYSFAGGGSAWCDSCNPRSTDIREAYHLAVAPDGAVWYTEDDSNRHVVRRITPGGTSVQRVAGQLDDATSDGDGALASAAHLGDPRGIAVAADGSVYIADNGNLTVRRILTNGLIVRVAGTASTHPLYVESGPALLTGLTGMEGLTIDPADGSVWFNEPQRDIVRRIVNPDSVSATMDIQVGVHSFERDDGCTAPDPNSALAAPFRWDGSSPADGSAARATTLCSPFGLSFRPDGGALYISDLDDRRIRKLDVASGRVFSVVGNGSAGTYGYGGAASAVTLHNDFGVLAASGRVFFADQTGTGNTRVVSIANGLPLVHLASGDSAPLQFQPVSLDAGGSSDPDGGPLSYHWDFGDGATGATTIPTTTHSFLTAGTHTVTVSATDEDGGTTSQSIAVGVRPFQLPPVAGFAATLKSLGKGKWKLTLDGSPSYDADGKVAHWTWTFSNAKASGDGELLSRTFAKRPTNLKIRLSVLDDPGQSDTTPPILVTSRVQAARKSKDSDADGVVGRADKCPTKRALVDPNHDGCDGPYVTRLSHYGYRIDSDQLPFGVRLTHLQVAGFVASSTVRLVCTRGCGASSLVLAQGRAGRDGKADVDLAGHSIDAGAELELEGLKTGWVSFGIPLLVRAGPTGGSLAEAGKGSAVCSTAASGATSLVPCQP